MKISLQQLMYFQDTFCISSSKPKCSHSCQSHHGHYVQTYLLPYHRSSRTIISDKGSRFCFKNNFRSRSSAWCTTTSCNDKHAQTIGILERTHASVKTTLKMSQGRFRAQWHKCLPLAVLNHNTTYHASLGCEPSRIFHGRIPYNILDHKLGYNPNSKNLTDSDIAEKIQEEQQQYYMTKRRKTSCSHTYATRPTMTEKRNASPLNYRMIIVLS